MCKKMVLVFFILPIGGCITDSEKLYNLVQNGNQYFSNKDYLHAMNTYEEGLTIQSENNVLNYNKASVLYRMSKYLDALQSYKKGGGDALAFKNMGNCNKKLGDNENNKGKQLELYKEALKSYKEAIILNERDLLVKFNYEWLKNKIEDLEKEVNKNQKQNKDEVKENKKQEQKQNSDSQDTKNKNQSQNQQTEQKNKKEKQEAHQSLAEEKNKDKIKHDTVMNILKALEQREKEDLKNNQKIKNIPSKREEYDW